MDAEDLHETLLYLEELCPHWSARARERMALMLVQTGFGCMPRARQGVRGELG